VALWSAAFQLPNYQINNLRNYPIALVRGQSFFARIFVDPTNRNGPSALKTTSITYADSGVDINRAERAKQRIKSLARRTFTRGVAGDIGGFGGLFAIDKKQYRQPVLVSSVDGVGTKLKVAFMMKRHNTVGADLVNHCVNDIAVQGATPLFFMDYLATGTLDPDIAESIIVASPPPAATMAAR